MKRVYDIVIVGAGPAGSSAARSAAQRGARVLVIDRRQFAGVPVQCAEFVPRWISRHAPFSSASVVQTVEAMVTHLSGEASHEMPSPGYMLDRPLFDGELLTSAMRSGAETSMATRAICLTSEGLVVERESKEMTIESKVIIGADGVHSSVARWLGLPRIRTLVALQYEIVNDHPQRHVDVFFHRDYTGGYAWFFPKGKTANVGLGVLPQKSPQLSVLLNHFVEDLAGLKEVSDFKIVSKTGGSIPRETRRQTVFGNLLLVGDAAGHAHPITGAGIFNAVIGGEIAGRVAAEAVMRGDLRHLENYEREWRETFGSSLEYGVLKRKFLEDRWDAPGVDFAGLLRKTWVGFKEYNEDRKKISLSLASSRET